MFVNLTLVNFGCFSKVFVHRDFCPFCFQILSWSCWARSWMGWVCLRGSPNHASQKQKKTANTWQPNMAAPCRGMSRLVLTPGWGEGAHALGCLLIALGQPSSPLFLAQQLPAGSQPPWTIPVQSAKFPESAVQHGQKQVLV